MNMSAFTFEGDWVGRVIASAQAEMEMAEDRLREEIMCGARCQSCEKPINPPAGDTTLCPECEAL